MSSLEPPGAPVTGRCPAPVPVDGPLLGVPLPPQWRITWTTTTSARTPARSPPPRPRPSSGSTGASTGSSAPTTPRRSPASGRRWSATPPAHGEIEYRRGNYEVAFAHLRRSVELDDALPYDEPWGLDATDPARTRRAVAGAGPGRRGRGDLPLGSRPRRQAQPSLPASGQPLEPARTARMPDPARRDGGGGPDQAAPRPGAGKIRGAGEGLLLLPHERSPPEQPGRETRPLDCHHVVDDVQIPLVRRRPPAGCRSPRGNPCQGGRARAAYRIRWYQRTERSAEATAKTSAAAENTAVISVSLRSITTRAFRRW